MIKQPLLRYPGGKWRLAPWIISFFPEHHTYVEPFCGAASVFLRKEPSYFEVLNDLDGDIINFFKVLRDSPEELIRQIDLTPWSREEVHLSVEPVDDPVERARRFYVKCWQGYGGLSSTGWRFQRAKHHHDKYSLVRQWARIPDQLYEMAMRIKQAQVEHDDALKVIQRFDTPDTLFYVDPPYVGIDKLYNHGVDHPALLDVLKGVQGKVILSNYDNPLYNELGWHKEVKQAKTNGNSLRQEVLWMNYG